MFRNSLRLKALFCKKPEIMSEDKLTTLTKYTTIFMMVVMTGASAYYYITDEQKKKNTSNFNSTPSM